MSAMIDHTRNPVWGQLLRSKVAESGLSQRAFADRHGFVARTFNSWCNGRWPGERVARDVAKALEVDYAAMVSERPIGIDADIMKTSITMVDERTAELKLSCEARATIYTLAYQFLAANHSRYELAHYVGNLLLLSNMQPH